MPEGDYGFKPSPMPDVRTYGQLFAHVAEGQFGTCATAKGVPNPNHRKSLEHELKTKAEFVKVLADSFAFCDDLFSALTDAGAMEFVKLGKGEVVRGAVLAGLLAHSSEMYGIRPSIYAPRTSCRHPPATERR